MLPSTVRLHAPAAPAIPARLWATLTVLMCAGREDVQTQFEADASEATDLDTFMREHATSMPRDLTEPQLLYAMALCVAEVAGAPPPLHRSFSHLWSPARL